MINRRKRPVKRYRLSNLLKIVGAVFAIGIGGMFFWVWGGSPLWQLWETRNWQSTPCQIVSGKLEQQYSHDRFTRSHGSGFGFGLKFSNDSEYVYRPAIIYSYTFNHQTYTGNRVALSQIFIAQKTAETIMRQYPENTSTVMSIPRIPARLFYREQSRFAYGYAGCHC